MPSSNTPYTPSTPQSIATDMSTGIKFTKSSRFCPCFAIFNHLSTHLPDHSHAPPLILIPITHLSPQLPPLLSLSSQPRHKLRHFKSPFGPHLHVPITQQEKESLTGLHRSWKGHKGLVSSKCLNSLFEWVLSCNICSSQLHTIVVDVV